MSEERVVIVVVVVVVALIVIIFIADEVAYRNRAVLENESEERSGRVDRDCFPLIRKLD